MVKHKVLLRYSVVFLFFINIHSTFGCHRKLRTKIKPQSPLVPGKNPLYKLHTYTWVDTSKIFQDHEFPECLFLTNIVLPGYNSTSADIPLKKILCILSEFGGLGSISKNALVFSYTKDFRNILYKMVEKRVRPKTISGYIIGSSDSYFIGGITQTGLYGQIFYDKELYYIENQRKMLQNVYGFKKKAGPAWNSPLPSVLYRDKDLLFRYEKDPYQKVAELQIYKYHDPNTTETIQPLEKLRKERDIGSGKRELDPNDEDQNIDEVDHEKPMNSNLDLIAEDLLKKAAAMGDTSQDLQSNSLDQPIQNSFDTLFLPPNSNDDNDIKTDPDFLDVSSIEGFKEKRASFLQVTKSVYEQPPDEINYGNYGSAESKVFNTSRNEGLICNISLAADYSFLSKFGHHGEGNEGMAIGKMMYLLNLVEWQIRSLDWDGEGYQENIGFEVQNIRMELEPGYLDTVKGGISAESQLRLFAGISEADNEHGAKACLTIGFTGHLVKGQYNLFQSDVFNDSQSCEGICSKRCSHVFEDGSVVTSTGNTVFVSTVNQFGAELPDREIVKNLLKAILNAFGGNPYNPPCDAAMDLDGMFQKYPEEREAYATPSNLKIHDCIKTQVVKHLIQHDSCLRLKSVAYCGNGVLEKGEECDCGYRSDCISNNLARKLCCVPRGNVVEQCKYAKKSQCYDNTNFCCTNNCQIPDYSKYGLNCRMKMDICENLPVQIQKKEKDKDKPNCGIWKIPLASTCVGPRCYSDECNRIGLQECICNSRVLNPHRRTCSTCCRDYKSGVCITAELLTFQVIQDIQDAFDIYFYNYQLQKLSETTASDVDDDAPAPPVMTEGALLADFWRNNATASKIWTDLRFGTLHQKPKGMSKQVDFCLRGPTGDKTDCLRIHFMDWKEFCTFQGSLGVCGIDYICRPTIKFGSVLLTEKQDRVSYFTYYKANSICVRSNYILTLFTSTIISIMMVNIIN